MCNAIQAEKEEILDSIREISRNIKLKDLIIAAFIPPAYQDKIVKHAHWDEYDAAWSIDAHSLGGNSVRGQRELASMQQAQMQPAYIPAGMHPRSISCCVRTTVVQPGGVGHVLPFACCQLADSQW